MKKHYLGKPVAIKIQKENESIADSIQLLDSAGKKKQCSFTVLICNITEEMRKWSFIPDNMIVLPKYQIQLEDALENLINE